MGLGMNTLELSSVYEAIGKALIKEREDLHHLDGVRIAYLASDQDKKSNGRVIFGECRKVSPQYAWCCPYDFMITIYEPNIIEYGFDEEQITSLIWHELLHCGVEDTDAGMKFRIIPHDIEDFDKIIAAAGMHWELKNMIGADPRG